MQSADILVNIGNTVENQIPSKLLTYISFGKPIINIMKSSNCPTLEYMNRYPLSYNILETFDLIEKEAKKLESFIYESNGKSIAFDQIEKIFYECTPSYVGKRLYDIVCEAIKNNKLKEEN